MPRLQPGTPAQLAIHSGLQNHQTMNSTMWSRILFYSSPFISDELRSKWIECMKVSQHHGRVREMRALNFQLPALVNGENTTRRDWEQFAMNGHLLQTNIDMFPFLSFSTTTIDRIL